MMKFFLALVLFLSFVTTSSAQIDSSYIRPFNYKLAVRTYLKQDALMLNQEFKDGEEKTWSSNRPANLGVGFSINNTIISLGYGYGFDFLRSKKYGKTRSIDFQLHNYGRKLVLDLYLQRYKGFYETDNRSGNITLYPDLKVQKYSVYGQYIFNNRKYSYKAAFDQSEKQLKSTGSFILGGGIYFTKINSDSSFIYLEKRHLSNFQLGVSGGYAYTWVLDQHWDISASATAGLNFGNEKVGDGRKEKIRIYPTLFPRLSAGYTRDSWSLGFSFLGNGIFSSISDGGGSSRIGVYSMRVEISFAKRFLAVPFIDKYITK